MEKAKKLTLYPGFLKKIKRYQFLCQDALDKLYQELEHCRYLRLTPMETAKKLSLYPGFLEKIKRSQFLR